MKTLIATLLLLASSAHAETYVDWVTLPEAELQQACNVPLSAQDTSPDIKVNGCYRMKGPVCRVYTRKPTDANDQEVHRTLGHEIRHCFEGKFHG